MSADNSTENVFRFLQVRPPLPVEEGPTVVLPASTPLLAELAPLPAAARTRLADKFLAGHPTAAAEILESSASRAILGAFRDVLAAEGTVQDFVDELSSADGGSRDAASKLHGNLANLLAACKFAAVGVPPETNQLARIFRGLAVLIAADLDGLGDTPLAEYLRRPLALPAAFAPPSPTTRRAATAVSVAPAGCPAVAASPVDGRREFGELEEAIEEIALLTRSDGLHVPRGSSDQPPRPAFTLSPVSQRRLTATTRGALERLALDPERQPITTLIGALEGQIAMLTRRAARTGTVLSTPALPQEPSDVERPYLRSVGVADLLVVKQHLLRYDRQDIAHVENVLAGEKKSRNHRSLERVEDTTISERETTTTKETELTTSERFELQREMTATAKSDLRLGFGFTLSGKYGPTVEFTSNAQLDASNSSEESVRTATDYAKEIASRSLERVTERVREEQRRTVIRELEETNLHELDNTTGSHIVGTYQFLEKVYESQVFNYGIREMFDFMVPEPASYLWALEKSPATDLNLPSPPIRLETRAASAGAITLGNYLELAALYGADGVAGPPPLLVSGSLSLKSGDGTDEEGQPRSIVEKDLTIPVGYRPFSAVVRPLALTDDALTIGITMGSQQQVWQPRNAPEVVDAGSGHDLAAQLLFFFLGNDTFARADQGTLPVQALGFETANYALTVDAAFLRTDEAFATWQQKTYDAIANAYRTALQKYEQQVAEAEAKAEAARSLSTRFGAPPSQNIITIRDELKKHCISIITRQRYDDFDATDDAMPPTFDFEEAAAEGSFIRFFEQAFEWDQLQYVFYPYYWARKSTWADRFNREDVDPAFRDFVRAGAARVVVPVRPGFEVAVSHYLETGVIWNGLGDPPEINSPLYVPIVTEIKERTGAGNGELPVGDPWLTHVPTPLAILRREDDLPRWQRVDPDVWEWTEVT